MKRTLFLTALSIFLTIAFSSQAMESEYGINDLVNSQVNAQQIPIEQFAKEKPRVKKINRTSDRRKKVKESKRTSDNRNKVNDSKRLEDKRDRVKDETRARDKRNSGDGIVNDSKRLKVRKNILRTRRDIRQQLRDDSPQVSPYHKKNRSNYGYK